MDNLILKIYGREAVNEANKCCDEMFSDVFPVFAKNGLAIIGESEPVFPLSYYDDFLNEDYSVDIVVKQNCYCDDVLAQLHDMGFAGMWCLAQIKYGDGSVESGAFFQI